jgi:hypothetical protein
MQKIIKKEQMIFSNILTRILALFEKLMKMILTMTPSNSKREILIKIREKGKKINNRVFIIKTVIDPLSSYDLSYFSYYWTHNHLYFFKNSIYLFLILRYNIFCL